MPRVEIRCARNQAELARDDKDLPLSLMLPAEIRIRRTDGTIRAIRRCEPPVFLSASGTRAGTRSLNQLRWRCRAEARSPKRRACFALVLLQPAVPQERGTIKCEFGLRPGQSEQISDRSVQQ